QFPAYRAVMMFSYLQDKWQVSPKLTVDFGVRHDFYPPATPRLKGGFSNYDPSNNTLVVAGYGNNPTNLGRKTYYTGFAQRMCFAYGSDRKPLVGGEFGLTWIPSPTNPNATNSPVNKTTAYPTPTPSGRLCRPPARCFRWLPVSRRRLLRSSRTTASSMPARP